MCHAGSIKYKYVSNLWDQDLSDESFYKLSLQTVNQSCLILQKIKKLKFWGEDTVIQAYQTLNNEFTGCSTGDRPLITFKFSLVPFMSDVCQAM